MTTTGPEPALAHDGVDIDRLVALLGHLPENRSDRLDLPLHEQVPTRHRAILAHLDHPEPEPQPGLADLVRTLAEPAPHDHRRLTPTQHALEAVARAAATGAILAAHTVLRAAVGAVNAARTARVAAHLLRNQ